MWWGVVRWGGGVWCGGSGVVWWGVVSWRRSSISRATSATSVRETGESGHGVVGLVVWWGSVEEFHFSRYITIRRKAEIA